VARSENPYTKAYHGALNRLAEAQASASQERAYLMLAQFHGTDSSNECECWTVAKRSAPTVRMTPHNFSTALRELTKKSFTDRHGRSVPVLVKVRGGFNNNPAVFYDNIYADVNGVETVTPKGDESPTPSNNVENREGVGIATRRGWNRDSKGLESQPPLEIDKNKRTSIGDAPRFARGAARRRTSTSQERTSESTFLVSSDGPQPEESGRHEDEAATRNTPTTQEEHDLTTVLGSIGAPTTTEPEQVKQKEPSKLEAAMLSDLWRELNKNPDHEMDPADRELYERYQGSKTWREIRTGRAV
jgi:hypothetical protein